MIWWDYLFEIFTNTTTFTLRPWTQFSRMGNVRSNLWSHFASVCRYWPEGLRPKIAQQSYVNVIHKILVNNVKLGFTFTASKQENEQKNSLLKQKCKTIQFMEKPETWPRPANRNCMPEIFLLSGKRDLWKNFSRLLATFRPNYHWQLL